LLATFRSFDLKERGIAMRRRVNLDPSCGSGGLNASQPMNSQQQANRSTTEQVRWSLLQTSNTLCIILIVGLIVVLPLASTVAFCVTKSILSFGLLSPIIPGITLLLRLRRRPEEFAFPLSPEDLQIRLKELDVEANRIEKQSTTASLPCSVGFAVSSIKGAHNREKRTAPGISQSYSCN
jgi:hypothetical protein